MNRLFSCAVHAPKLLNSCSFVRGEADFVSDYTILIFLRLGRKAVIPSGKELQKLQNAQKAMLLVFHDFCAAHDITYYLVAGSALGAVRHGDMIPWDDDIDVGLLRGDYEKFLDIAGKSLNEEIFVQTQKTDHDYPFFYAKLRLNNTLFHEPAVSNLNIHRGIFLDIFPFDAVKSNTGIPAIRHSAMSILSLLSTSSSWRICMQSKSFFMRLVRLTALALRRLVPKRFLHRTYDKLAKTDDTCSSNLICCFEIYSLRNYKRTIFPKSGLIPPQAVNFGSMNIMIPKEADAYLKSIFGEYMEPPPPELRVPGHAERIEFYDSHQ